MDIITGTDLSSVDLVPDWYLQMCWSSDFLQSYWLDYYTDELGILRCHVNVGDRFSLGKNRQFGWITKKTLEILSSGVMSHYSFEIAGDIGGYYFHQTRDRLITDNFMFVPTAEQLAGIGFFNIARDLVEDVRKRRGYDE